MNEASFLQYLQQQGFPQPVQVEREAGYALGEHAHEFDACALITLGQFEISMTGVSKLYQAGDVFELPRGTLHSERCVSGAASYLSSRRN